MAHLMAESSLERIPFSSSVKRGSTFTWMTMSLPRASAALRRTARFESCRALVKVVCNWGKNGFRAISTYTRDERMESGAVKSETVARNQSLETAQPLLQQLVITNSPYSHLTCY